MRQKLFTNLKKLLRTNKSDIVWLAYHQGKIFQKFRSEERFVNDVVSKFKVSKLTIVFKIALSRLIEKYPKKALCCCFIILKKLKLIKEVCKENAIEFK